MFIIDWHIPYKKIFQKDQQKLWKKEQALVEKYLKSKFRLFHLFKTFFLLQPNILNSAVYLKVKILLNSS